MLLDQHRIRRCFFHAGFRVISSSSLAHVSSLRRGSSGQGCAELVADRPAGEPLSALSSTSWKWPFIVSPHPISEQRHVRAEAALKRPPYDTTHARSLQRNDAHPRGFKI